MNNQLAVINTIYEAFGKGVVPTILEQMADDVQWEQWVDNFAQLTDTAKHIAAAKR